MNGKMRHAVLRSLLSLLLLLLECHPQWVQGVSFHTGSLVTVYVARSSATVGALCSLITVCAVVSYRRVDELGCTVGATATISHHGVRTRPPSAGRLCVRCLMRVACH